MKRLLLAAVAALSLGGCIAVPGPYGAEVYPAVPAVGVGVYAAPGYYRYPYYHRHRHW